MMRPGGRVLVLAAAMTAAAMGCSFPTEEFSLGPADTGVPVDTGVTPDDLGDTGPVDTGALVDTGSADTVYPATPAPSTRVHPRTRALKTPAPSRPTRPTLAPPKTPPSTRPPTPARATRAVTAAPKTPAPTCLRPSSAPPRAPAPRASSATTASASRCARRVSSRAAASAAPSRPTPRTAGPAARMRAAVGEECTYGAVQHLSCADGHSPTAAGTCRDLQERQQQLRRLRHGPATGGHECARAWAVCTVSCVAGQSATAAGVCTQRPDARTTTAAACGSSSAPRASSCSSRAPAPTVCTGGAPPTARASAATSRPT
jgi:hypothetical protein